MSEGNTIYNGSVSDIKGYFDREFNLKLPMYTNPADYLIKLAVEPTYVRGDLKIDGLKKVSDKYYKEKIDSITLEVSKYTKEDIKGVKTIRSSGFKKQVKVLLRRQLVGFERVPLVVFALFGMGVFAVFLIASIYYNMGGSELSYFDMEENKKVIKNWVGCSFYMSNDLFAWAIMSQAI